MKSATEILQAIGRGEAFASERLLALVYDELRCLAVRQLAGERLGQTLQATDLVHEAYLRLVGDGPEPIWAGRGHFFAAAAEAMRRILVENARRKRRLKHGGDRRRVDLDDVAPIEPRRSDDLLAVDEALSKLARESPQKADLVKLRYFGGFTIEEAAGLLGISHATAKRYWTYARAWLFAELRDGEPPEENRKSDDFP